MYLLLDVGGTKIRIASSDGQSLDKEEILETPQYYLSAIKLIKDTLAKSYKSKKFTAAVMGLPGPMDPKKTMLINATNIADWNNQPIKNTLQDLINAPVFLENDAALVGLGEAMHGAGVGKRIVSYLTISTGVGGSRIVNGKIDENSLGFEPGAQIIAPEGVKLDGLISGNALEKFHGKKSEDIDDPEVWDKVAKVLSIGINNTLVFWSPDIVVLGGSVSKSINIDSVRKYTKETVKIFPKIPPITKAKLGDLGGLYGGMAYLNQINS
jgi:predicted NBD/HSP70 family sugar kinase